MQAVIHEALRRFAFTRKSKVTTIAFAALMAGCGGCSLFVSPGIPASKSSIVPPEITNACPIVDSSINSLVNKGNLLYEVNNRTNTA